MSRDVNAKEKVLLVILVLIILGFCYYRFVDQPIRKNLAKADAEYSSLQTELTEANVKIRELQRMQDEIDEITTAGKYSYMPSYNNAKEELALLNDILSGSATQYSVSFTDVTRNKDQIRRNFKLTFSAPDYETMRGIIDQLTGVDYRCLIGDCTSKVVEVRNQREEYTLLSVSATATFFETMVGGVVDAGLPADSSKK
ncbi:MAG: hypothetical protein IKN20_00405 [Firmicutes bacterium]|nr:hypothetical protein [Bacillota bacterium]